MNVPRIVQVAVYFIQEIRVSSLFRLSDWEVYGPILLGNESLHSLFFGRTLTRLPQAK